MRAAKSLIEFSKTSTKSLVIWRETTTVKPDYIISAHDPNFDHPLFEMFKDSNVEIFKTREFLDPLAKGPNQDPNMVNVMNFNTEQFLDGVHVKSHINKIIVENLREFITKSLIEWEYKSGET